MSSREEDNLSFRWITAEATRGPPRDKPINGVLDLEGGNVFVRLFCIEFIILLPFFFWDALPMEDNEEKASTTTLPLLFSGANCFVTVSFLCS